MAHGKSLEMRAIRPHVDYSGASVATRNEWRELSSNVAKQRRCTRRRVLKSLKRANRQ